MNNNENFYVHNIPFMNDNDVIGKWEYYDIIKSEEQFNYNKTKS